MLIVRICVAVLALYCIFVFETFIFQHLYYEIFGTPFVLRLEDYEVYEHVFNMFVLIVVVVFLAEFAVLDARDVGLDHGRDELHNEG